MKRTQSRPLPLNILTKTEALIFCVSIGLSGLYLLSLINIKCLLLGLLSIVLYVLAYTPLKKITPFSVFIGAIPGSIPPLLGYVSVSNAFGLEPGILFLVQFFGNFHIFGL